MKLRNKKTGEIIEDAQYRNYSTSNGFGIRTPTDEYFYKSLKEFYEDWEDYTYQEPLIKDEKIRKAVRAWAEANEIPYYDTSIEANRYEHHLRWINTIIMFNKYECLENLIDDKIYTIAELCGEEE